MTRWSLLLLAGAFFCLAAAKPSQYAFEGEVGSVDQILVDREVKIIVESDGEEKFSPFDKIKILEGDVTCSDAEPAVVYKKTVPFANVFLPSIWSAGYSPVYTNENAKIMFFGAGLTSSDQFTLVGEYDSCSSPSTTHVGPMSVMELEHGATYAEFSAPTTAGVYKPCYQIQGEANAVGITVEGTDMTIEILGKQVFNYVLPSPVFATESATITVNGKFLDAGDLFRIVADTETCDTSTIAVDSGSIAFTAATDGADLTFTIANEGHYKLCFQNPASTWMEVPNQFNEIKFQCFLDGPAAWSTPDKLFNPFTLTVTGRNLDSTNDYIHITPKDSPCDDAAAIVPTMATGNSASSMATETVTIATPGTYEVCYWGDLNGVWKKLPRDLVVLEGPALKYRVDTATKMVVTGVEFSVSVPSLDVTGSDELALVDFSADCSGTAVGQQYLADNVDLTGFSKAAFTVTTAGEFKVCFKRAGASNLYPLMPFKGEVNKIIVHAPKVMYAYGGLVIGAPRLVKFKGIGLTASDTVSASLGGSCPGSFNPTASTTTYSAADEELQAEFTITGDVGQIVTFCYGFGGSTQTELPGVSLKLVDNRPTKFSIIDPFFSANLAKIQVWGRGLDTATTKIKLMSGGDCSTGPEAASSEGYITDETTMFSYTYTPAAAEEGVHTVCFSVDDGITWFPLFDANKNSKVEFTPVRAIPESVSIGSQVPIQGRSIHFEVMGKSMDSLGTNHKIKFVKLSEACHLTALAEGSLTYYDLTTATFDGAISEQTPFKPCFTDDSTATEVKWIELPFVMTSEAKFTLDFNDEDQKNSVDLPGLPHGPKTVCYAPAVDQTNWVEAFKLKVLGGYYNGYDEKVEHGRHCAFGDCGPCKSGKYSSYSGELMWKFCRACPFGSYQPSMGKSYCLTCPAGQTTDFPGSKDSSDCHA